MSFQWYTRHSPEEHTRLQLKFVTDVVEMMRTGTEVIFMDETSVNLWNYKNKVWMSREEPIKVNIVEKKLSHLTIIGGISNKMKELAYTLASSTSSESVVKFFKHMIK